MIFSDVNRRGDNNINNNRCTCLIAPITCIEGLYGRLQAPAVIDIFKWNGKTSHWPLIVQHPKMSSHRSGAESPQLTESENAYSEPIFHHRPLPGKRFSHGGSNHHHHRKLSLPHSMSSSHYYMPVPPYSPRSPARSLVSSSSCSSSRPISSTGFYKTKKTTTGFFKRRCTVEDEGSFMKLDSGWEHTFRWRRPSNVFDKRPIFFASSISPPNWYPFLKWGHRAL